MKNKIVSILIVFILSFNIFTVSFATVDGEILVSLQREIPASSYHMITFDEKVDIIGFTIRPSISPLDATISVKLEFYNDSGLAYSWSTGSPDERTVEKYLVGINKIKIINNSYFTTYGGQTYQRSVRIEKFYVYGPKPTLPDQVRNVRVKDMTATSATITWDPNPGAEKYIVYLDGQHYGETTNTEYTIDGLQSNTSYTVVIAAVNKAGEGPPSEPCTFTTPELPPEPPTKVMNVNVKDMTATSVLISWDPNPEPEGVLKYVIYLNGQKYGETTNTEYKIDNLQPNTSYEVTITAVNNDGEGPQSDPCTFRTPELPPEPATQVKNIVIRGLTSTSATISWAPNPGAERITKYIIYINGEKYGETEDTEYTIEGLEEGLEYTVSIAAVNTLGEGPASDPITFTPSKLADISSTINIQDILSTIGFFFTNLWPLLAFALALIAVVPITTVLKQTVRRRFDA